jgi:hypothetical protein
MKMEGLWPFAISLLLGCVAPLPPVSAPSNAPSALLEVPASTAAGFNFPYLLVLPKQRHRPSPVFLLVEPNNTGTLADDLEPHRQGALKLATRSSVGKFVADELDVPFLVPIFPRPKSAPSLYTHALDRDTLLIDEGLLKRLDLQLIAMIDDARTRLGALGMVASARILLNGFSASGTFANRFALIHPERVQAVACGGINASLMLPVVSSRGMALPFPLGIQDLTELTGVTFSLETWQRVPQLVYMGANDDNDAVAFDDGYSPEERRVVHALFGEKMQPDRWLAVQAAYRAAGADVTFRTYAGIGHGTNGAINQDVAEFFRAVMAAPDAAR